MAARQLTISEAISREFDIKITECEKLRTAVNSLIDNDVIPIERIPGPHHSQRRLHEQQLPALHNAVLLHALFGDVRLIKAIFNDRSVRCTQAELAAAILFQRNSLMGIALQGTAVQGLVSALRGDLDLRHERLPNPFAILPYQMNGNVGGLLVSLLAQSATVSAGDSVLLAYLQGELGLARQRILAMTELPPELVHLQQRILDDCRDAEELDAFLSNLRNR